MSNDFLDSLASILEDQFSIGENKVHTLDSSTASGNGAVRYGALGEFSSKFDKSQERRYFEQGYLRTDSFNAVPRQAEVYFQEPSATVLVKKRAFSSLAENFQEENLDKEERIFIKATKVLFQNKTIQISAYENLCKAKNVLEKNPNYAQQLMPLIMAMVERMSNSGIDSESPGISLNLKQKSDATNSFKRIKSVTDKIKTLYAFSSQSTYTTWITDSTNPWKSTFGQGTGVIELTNVKSFNAKTSVSLGEGQCGLHFSDPYNLMTITSYDIERAISDATNVAYNSSTFQFGKDNLKIAINDLKTQLDNRRLARGASKIQFIVNANTVLGKRVRAVIDGAGIEIPFTYTFSDDYKFDNSVDVPQDYMINGDITGSQGLDNRKKAIRTITSGYGGVALDPYSKKTLNSEPGVSYKSWFESSEFTLFRDIITKTFDLLTLEENAKQNIKKSNQDTNYVRKKMRLHYLGKSIIQPMDQVHIYISSKSKEDRKIVGGMRSSMAGLSFKQGLNSTFANFNTIKASLKPSSDVYAQIEKSAFVGDDFPTWLWPFFRDAFTNDNDGVHVFGGVINSATSSYSSGVYELNCSASSMAEYFNQGRFNWKPSVNVFNGELLDPLTIYKTRSDSVSYDSVDQTRELLEENQKIVNSGLIRYSSGDNLGSVVTKGNLVADQEIGALGQRKSIVYEPDGLVHRWKEGIGTLTQHSMYSGNSRTGYQPSFYEEPFAGQDIMNIISILVTGVPYNFVTYFKSALKVGTERVDPQKLKVSIQSQMSSLRSGISKNNMIWGNFVPFKNLVVNDAEIIRTINAQSSLSKKSSEISAALDKIAKAQNIINKMTFEKDKLSPATANGTGAASDIYDKEIKAQRALIEAQNKNLNNLHDEFYRTFPQEMKNIVVIGDDVSYDTYGIYSSGYERQLSQSKSQAALNSDNTRKKVRKKINFLTRRFARDVRANQDKNLFIVDDNYDKDYDIWVFNAKNRKLELFNSEYSSVKDKIEKLSSFLDLEIFCDTQGHIRARSPQYNKMPSSVFFKLIKMKNEYGTRLYPAFLENLISDQLHLALQDIALIEDKIRLHCAALGKNSDADVNKFISSSGDLSSNSSKYFYLISNESGEIDALRGIKNDSIEVTESERNFKNTLDGQLKIRNIFVLTFDLYSSAQNTRSTQNRDLASLYSEPGGRVEKIVNRILRKYGEKITSKDFVSANGTSTPTKDGNLTSVDMYKVYKNISGKLLERQNLIKKAASLLKNAIEIKDVESNKGVQNALLMPEYFDYQNIPDIFENLIEDESFDEFGPGSGSRFVIKDSQIKSLTIRETPPNFTSVAVIGSQDILLQDGPQGLNASFNGQNLNFQNSAVAVDYDMWRMYGFKSTQAFNAPFLKDPDSQCAPMAVSILNKARSEIFTGEVSIIGNEYMQPGDVVYLEGRDLLFYVQSVDHSFGYNSKSFNTNLRLTYGRPPGEYIPTKMDMIGKILFRNRESGSVVLHRHSNSYGEKPLGAIFIDRYAMSKLKDINKQIKEINSKGNRSGTSVKDDQGSLEDQKKNHIYEALFEGGYGNTNEKVINQIINEISVSTLQNQDENTIVKFSIVARIYRLNESQDQNELITSAALVNDIIKGGNVPSKYANKVPSVSYGSAETDGKLETNRQQINLKNPNETRSPSKYCMDLVQKLMQEGMSPTTDEANIQADTEAVLISNYILDFFLVKSYEKK